MTESTWKILKLDWKTPGIFLSKRVGTLHLLDIYYIFIFVPPPAALRYMGHSFVRPSSVETHFA